MSSNWADLPPDLLRSIAKILTTSAADYIRFRAVCSTWRSSTNRTPPHLPTQLPWLLLPPTTPHLRRLRFLSLSSSKIHSLPLGFLSLLRRLGSSHGWLTLLDPPTGSLSLLNPLTGSTIALPSFSSFPNVVSFDLYSVGREYLVGDRHVSLEEMANSFIKKIVLSANPAQHQNYIVLAVLNITGKLAWCRNGDRSWRYIEGSESYCEDVIHRDGLFYAVNKAGNIALCDVRGPTMPRIIETAFLEPGDLHYLATSSGGDLLLIARYMESDYVHPYLDNGYRTTRFEVFRLDEREGGRWDRVTDLGDEMVFVGENSTFALSSRGLGGCRGNRIYYTDDCCSEYDRVTLYGEHDSGIYDLGNGSNDPLPCCLHYSYSPRLWPPPMWLTPYPFL